MVIGLAPSRDDLVMGRPLSGGYGNLLWKIAKSAGFARADCYVVNVVGEWPDKKNGEPSAAQLSRWRPAFDELISKSKARVIVPLGKIPLQQLAGLDGGIEAWRGYLVHPDECRPVMVSAIEMTTYKSAGKAKGVSHKKGDPRAVKVSRVQVTKLPANLEWILPTLDPEKVMRSGLKTLPAFKADLDRVARVLEGKLRPRHKFHEMIDSHISPAESGPVCLDVETAPDWDIVRIGVATEREAWTAPWSGGVRSAVQQILDTPDRVLIAHNIQFDLQRLAEAGVQFDGPLYDTMLAAQLLQPDLYKGLNEVASLYMDLQRWKHLSDSRPAFYNLEDAKNEYELYEITRALLTECGQLKLFEGTIMPAVRVLSRMTRRGLKLHPTRRIEWLNELTVEENRLYGQWQSLVGNVNPASPLQVRAILYRKYRLPLKLNKVGDETAEKAALHELLRELGDEPSEPRQVIETLLSIRTTSKLLRSYARRPVSDDGCVHPYYLPVTKDSDREDTGKGMAGTGRPQARNPNIQQLPPDARKIVVPHSDDLVLVSFDFKQLELRIAAQLSGDAELKEALRHGIFERVQEQLQCDRTRAKNIVYGTLYGGGPRALVRALKSRGVHTTEAECRVLQDRFAAAYPKLWLWRQQLVSQVSKQYFLTNPYSRRRYFYRGAGDAPAAIDFMPQGTAADIVWSDFVPGDATISDCGGALLATVHDEALTEMPRNNLGAGVNRMLDTYQRIRPELGEDFWVPVGVKVGEDWGHMVELTEWETAYEAAA